MGFTPGCSTLSRISGDSQALGEAKDETHEATPDLRSGHSETHHRIQNPNSWLMTIGQHRNVDQRWGPLGPNRAVARAEEEGSAG